MTRLDKAANMALIIAYALFIGNLARNYYISRIIGPSVKPDINEGELVRLPGDDSADRQPGSANLVMALSIHS